MTKLHLTIILVTLGMFMISLLSLVLGGLNSITITTFILGLLGVIIDDKAEEVY